MCTFVGTSSLAVPDVNYQICTRCIMDTSDPRIEFDTSGICSHCHAFDRTSVRTVFTGDEGRRRLQQRVEEIKRDGRAQEYDAVMGVSGGVDSSYAALIAKEEGLRILAVHCDSGWNSEGAVHNIEKLVKTLGVDLVTVVLDWEEVRDLQVAFFKASVANCDIPQDHAFNAAVYKVAGEQRIKHIITGGNHARMSRN